MNSLCTERQINMRQIKARDLEVNQIVQDPIRRTKTMTVYQIDPGSDPGYLSILFRDCDGDIFPVSLQTTEVVNVMDGSMELKDLFPYEYSGGGYFREKGVPKGKTAEILHGMEAIKYLYKRMTGGSDE